MSLSDKLVQIPLRETSGSRSSSRFLYQKHWALLKLLRCHLEEQDYVFIFDYHDDVLILDSEENPTKIKFYQIKTNGRNNWTIEALIKQENGAIQANGNTNKLPSILGKMYLNKINFGDEVGSLNFVSNARFNVKLADESQGDSLTKNLIRVSEINDEKKNKIKNALKDETGIEPDATIDNIIFLEVTSLPLENHETQVKGELVEFLNQLFPQRSFFINAIYQAILGEITRRNDTTGQQSTFAELSTKKCLSRRDFLTILDTIGLPNDFEQDWGTIETRLNSERCAFPEIVRIRHQWKTCAIHRLDVENLTFQKRRSTVKKLIERYELESCSNLVEFMNEVYQLFVNEKASGTDKIDPAYIKAMILMEFYERCRQTEI